MKQLVPLGKCLANFNEICYSRLLAISFFFLFGLNSTLSAQNANLQVDGNSAICIQEFTTLEVIIGASINPYTVVYSDGTTNFTINNYNSDADIESPTFGGDPIVVSPSVTTTYSLISVTDQFNTSLPITVTTVTIVVNPLPSNLTAIVNSGNAVCYNTPFLIEVSAVDGDTYELWNAANTTKIGDLPFNTSITADTNYTVRAISANSCITAENLSIVLENNPPSISGEGDKTLNTSSGTCDQSLPDYRSTITVSDNCSAVGNISLSQNPSPGFLISSDGMVQGVVITATDESGNESTYGFNVTLQDNQTPDITCFGNQSQVANASCEYINNGTAWNATATDNCSISSLVYVLSGATSGTGTDLDGVTFFKGVTTVTWIATDTAGLVDSCSFNVDVTDATKPTITCVSNQVENTANDECNYTHSDTSWDATINDNCDTPAASYILTGATTNTITSTLTGTVFNQGLTTVTITATDASGNEDTCSFSVTINDQELPLIVDLPAPITLSNNVNSCVSTVNWAAPTATDNCSIQSFVQTSSPTAGLVSGDNFPIGTTTITYTATDTNGNSTAENFTVSVLDTQNPEITCPINISQNSDLGICGAVISYVVPVGTDNCASVNTFQTAGLTPGSIFPVGITTNTFEVTDASGNTTSCSFTITVIDVENPSIVDLPSNIVISNDVDQCGAMVSWVDPTSADNCTGSSILQTTGLANGLFFPLGETTIGYTATDASNNTFSASFTITVNDTQLPVIANCPINISKPSTIGLCATTVSWTEPSVSDNCSADPNIIWTKSHQPGDMFTVGTTTVTYIATDESNNSSLTCSFDVTVEDIQKPVINDCPLDIVTNADAGGCNAIVSWVEPTFIDNCATSATIIWNKSHLPGDTFPSGITTVTYSAVDESGNVSTTCSFDITVNDNEAPVASCLSPTLFLDATGTVILTSSDIDGGSTDNCTSSENLTFTFNQATFSCSDLGANTITVTVTDEAGNQDTCTATVTIVDNIAPTLTATAGMVNANLGTDNNLCSYAVSGSEFDPLAIDNCSNLIVSYTVSGATTLSGTNSLDGEALFAGVNIITWTVTDGTNTSAPIVFEKTVVDTQSPTITAVSNQFKNTTIDVCGYVVSGAEFDAAFSDNCAVTTTTYTINSDVATVASTLDGAIIPPGINTIVWTVSDGLNSRSSSFRVTVIDAQNPTISSITTIEEDIDSGCDKVITWLEPSVADNCPGVLLNQIEGLTNGASFPVGTTTITYLATDTSANTFTITFDVIVSDNTPPVLTCVSGSTEVSPFVKTTDSGSCFYTVLDTQYDATTFDACDVNEATNSFDGTATLEGKQLPVGDNTIIWTSTDENNNTSTCTIYIRVEDTQAPTFTVPSGNFARSTDPTHCYYTVPDAIFDLKDLADNCALQPASYSISRNGIEEFTGISSLSGIQLPKDVENSYVVEWTLSDVNGNSVIAPTFSITISDNQVPSFECYGNENRIITGNSCNYSVNGAEFDPTVLTDNCDASEDLTVSYLLDGVSGGSSRSLGGEALSTGLHTVVWTVTDTEGNATSCEFNLTISDQIVPTIAAVSNQTKNALSDSCDYTVVGSEFDPATVTDNCPGVLLTNNQSGTTTLNGFTFPAGITVVVWTATDAGGNVSTLEYQVAVNDVIAPDFELVNDTSTTVTITKPTNSEDCFYTVLGAEFDPQAITDNCTSDNYTIINDYNNYKSLAFAEFPTGTTLVIWSVTDNYGNVSAKTLEITVVDEVKPTFNCPANAITRVSDNGVPYYTVKNNSELKPEVTDNCGITSYTYEVTGVTTASGTSLSGVQLNEGVNTITWTASDNATIANVEVCSFTVNVESSLYPTITCVDNQFKATDTAACSYTVQGTEFDTTVSVGGTLINDFNNSASLVGAVFPEGITLVTFTASQVVQGVTYENTCTLYVTVTDTVLPTITAPAAIITGTTILCRADNLALGTPTTADNCGVLRVWNNSDDIYSLGTQSVTWFVEDVHGNIASDTQEITIVDDDAPVFVCRTSITRRIDEGETYYTVYDNEFKPYRLFDCSSFTQTNDFNNTDSLTGEQFSSGVTTVTWTFTDSLGNTSTCVMTITINDATDPSPSITCRAYQERNTDLGSCTYSIQGVELDVTSTTPGTTLTYVLTGETSGSGSTSLNGVVFNRGITTVTWTATNGVNSNSYCSYDIFVRDNQLPVITWPADVDISTDIDSCDATNVNVGTASTIDNCDGTTGAAINFIKSPDQTTFPEGETLVYWRAIDQNNNTVYHTQKVTVTDNIAPVITCSSTTFFREYSNIESSSYIIQGNEFTPAVSDNCKLVSYTNNINGTSFLNGEELTAGDYTITWTAHDGVNTTTCDVTIQVVDALTPVIRCSSNETVDSSSATCTYEVQNGETLYDATFVSLSGADRTMTHDLAGAPSNITLAGAVIPVGLTTITWTATQTINGTSYSNTCSFEFTVEDKTSPVISTPFDDVSLNINTGTCINTSILTPPTVTDNCTLPENMTITNNAPVSFILGTTIVRWVVLDEAGNETIYNQNVTVVDNEAPIIINCPISNITVAAEGASCQKVVSWPALSVIDDCSGVASFTSTHTAGSLFDIGTTTVTYTATDNNGQISTCSFDIIVTDEPPVISCLSNQIKSTDVGTCAHVVLGNELDAITFSDSCAAPSLTWSFTNPDTGSLVTGTNTLSGITIPRGPENGANTGKIDITWTATDSNGQAASCTFELTIEDTEAPIIIVPGNQTKTTDVNQNYHTVSAGEFDDVSANDNCGIITKIVNEFGVATLDGQQLAVGNNSITWTATDDSGNTGIGIFTVMVIDAEAPRLSTSPSSVTVNTISGCSAVVNYIAPTFLDNVSAPENLNITISPVFAVPGYDFPLGDTALTYTVEDEANNSFEYKFTVTVIDDINPEIICVTGDVGNQFNRNTDTNKAFYTASGIEFNPTSFSDNCDVTVENDFNNKASLAGDTFPIGTTDVIWTATDDSGNTASCLIQIIVADVELPVINNCPDATINRNAELGQCYYLIFGSEFDPYDFTDNAGISKLTYAIDGAAEVGTNLNTTLSGIQIPVGTIANPSVNILWRLYDLYGNISGTCTTEFIISDTEKPSFTTITTQVRSLDAGFSTYTTTSATDASWDIPATDNCGLETITYTIDGGTVVGTDLTTSILGETFTIGTHTIVWEATDINANINTGTYQVIVEDNEDPTVVCNAITIQLDATGNYTLTTDNINAIALGSSDPSGIDTTIVSSNSFDCTEVGDNTVTVTVTDLNGNSSSCQATITVQDSTAPTALCKPFTVALDALGVASITTTDIDNGSTDTCGNVSLSLNKTTFDCSEVGDNTVTLIVTDENGNISTCDTIVTVTDTIAPVAVCKNISVALDLAGNATIVPLDIDNGSFDNCQNELVVTISKSSFDCTNVGLNNIILTVTDSDGNSSTCTAVVTIEDTIAPIAIAQNITVNLDATGNVSITAGDIDNGSNDTCGIASVSIDKTNFNCADLGANPATNTVVLTVTDVNNNIATTTALVTVEDDVAPVINCIANQAVVTDNDICGYTNIGSSWNATATDGCVTIDNLTYSLSGATVLANALANTTLDGQVFNSGETTVTWIAIDGSNVSSQCSYTVSVNDTTNPIAIGQDITIQLDASGDVNITTTDINDGSTDNCGIQSLSLDKTDFTCADFGANTVILTVIDTSGNISTDTVTVTVEDTIAPVAVCSPITVQLNTSGNYSLSISNINTIASGSTDNCPNFTTSVSPNTFDCSTVGANTVTLTITDIAGNTNTCTTTVTVEDSTAPTAICQNITVQLDASGIAVITAADIDNGSNDACGIASLVASKTNFACADIGSNSVTLTVTDTNGNQSTCLATVTIEDNVAPVFTYCPTNFSTSTDLGFCAYTLNTTSLNPNVTDNCDVTPTISYSLSGVTTGTGTNLNGVLFNQGVTNVTWTAADAEGNSTTCNFTVSINDTEPPIANVQDITVQLQRDGTVQIIPSDIDNGSTDNCGIISYEISSDGGTTYGSSVLYDCSNLAPTFNQASLRITDASGLSSLALATITVQDKQAPTLDDLTDRNEITDTDLCTYTHLDTLWNPTDNCDTTPTITYTLAGATTTVTGSNATLNGQVFESGTTTVTWTVSDNAAPANTGTVSFTVIVTDTQNPIISCPSNITQDVANAGDASATIVGITAPIYSDNCVVAKLTYELSGATIAAAQASGINELSSADFNLGTTTVTYLAEDAAGNTEICNFLVTINALPENTIIVSETSIQTSENLTTNTFTVVLPFAPSGIVVFDIASDDPTEGTVSTSILTFDPSNWNVPQTITVTGVNDDVQDGDSAYNIVLTTDQAATDDLSGYENVNPSDVAVTNLDNDIAGVTVSNSSNPTTEGLGIATFTIVLDTEPIENVTITLTGDDATELGSLDISTVTFTPADWENPQTITVTGKDDDLVDGDISYAIVTSNASSLDPNYDALVIADVSVINEDNDTAGVIVTPTSITTTEAGGTAIFSVVLTSKPATDAINYTVVVNVASSNTGEGIVDKSSLTFTASDWNIPQIVTVTGIDDILVDGTIAYTILNTIDAALTTDANYDIVTPDDVSVNNTDNDSATLSIDSLTQTEADSGSVDYVFTITHAGAEIVGGYGVTFFTSNVEARAPSDFTGNGGIINFTTGAIGETKTVTISVNGDTSVEINETFNVVLNSVVAPGKDITINSSGKTGIGTIIDNDNTNLFIADVSISEDNSGTSILTFTVELTKAIEDGLTIDYTTVDGTAMVANSDYLAKSGTLTFEGSEGEQEIIEIVINGDEIIELDETFLVNLSNIVPVSAPVSSVAFSDDSAIGTITNDDAALISISGFIVNESTGTADFTITTNKSIQNEITVDFVTSDNTALSGTDYTTIATRTLTFGGGNAESQTISIAIDDDLIIEPAEVLDGVLSNLITNGQDVSITTASATGTITDNDTATLSIDDVSVDEGAGTATFTITLTGTVQNDFTVAYATSDNSAIATSDYTPINATSLTFGNSNSNTQSFTVDITENTITEATETYHINLSGLEINGQTGISISKAQGVGTITDNDALSLSIAGFSITESEVTQTGNFRVSSSIAAEEDIVFTLSTTHVSTTEGLDYTTQTSQSYTLLAGETSIDLPVSILGDVIAEMEETFTATIVLDNANGQDVSITTASAAGTITDNDTATLSIDDVSVDEGAGTATFTITLTGTVQNDFTVDYATLDASAEAGSDYTVIGATTLSFGGGNNNVQSVSVAITENTIAEPTETYFVNLSGLTDNGQTGISISDGQGEGEITDNDSATISITGFSVDEAVGTANFTISISQAVQNIVVLDFETSTNSAISPSDYTAMATTLSFGESNLLTQIVSIPILDDILVEPTESLNGVLSSLVVNGQAVNFIGNLSSIGAIGTIIDNDTATITIADVSLLEVDEGETLNYEFTVTHNGKSTDGPFTIDFTTSNIEAEAGLDYVGKSSTITFSGATSETQTIGIVVRGDDILEPNESFHVSLTEADFGARAITFDDAVGLGTIINNDISQASIAATVQASEPGSNGEYTIRLSNAVSVATTIDYSVGGSATAADDYTALSGSITIAAGATEGTIDVLILDDNILEGDETIVVRLTGTANSVSIAAADEATLTLSDDDSSEVSIAATVQASEPGSNGEYTIRLSNPVSVATTISYSVGGSATAGDDYTALSGSITIAAGDTEGTIDILVVEDLLVEGTENLIVSITAADNSVNIGAIYEATLMLSDDDGSEVNIRLVNDASEASSNGAFEITLDAPVLIPTSIDFIISGTATGGLDYALIEGTIIIPANSVSVIIPVTIIDDDIVEYNGETIILTLDIEDGILFTGAQNEAILMIADDEVPTPDITLIKTAELSGNGGARGSIIYTFLVRNTGNVPLEFIQIEDPLLSVEPIQVLAVLQRNEEMTISREYEITQADIDTGSVTNTAYVFATDTVLGATVDDTSDNGLIEDGDDNPTIIELSQIEGLALLKTAEFNDENFDGISQIGETITYRFAVTNTGSVTLSSVMVEDLLPGVVLFGDPIVLEPGESDTSTFTATYTITVDDIADRKVINQATVYGTTLSGKVVQDLSDETDTTGDTPTETSLSGCELKIFNAVSPDADGENDIFLVEGIACFPQNKVEVYNRWGKIVFEREQYNNKDIAFRGISEVKGTINQSRELPDGTYFYVIKYVDFDGDAKSRAGYLYINRR